MHWDDLQFRANKYRSFKAYGQSKLANVLFTYELARRLEGTGVTANTLHPGVIASGFGHTYPGPVSMLLRMVSPFLLTPEEGAATTIYLASSPEVEGVTGKYFSKCRPVRSNAVSQDVASQRKLWALSVEMLSARAAVAA